MSAELVNVQVLQQIVEAIPIGEGPVRELLGVFRQDTGDRIERIHALVEGGQDSEGLRRAAHSLVGSTATFGAVQLESTCRQLLAIGQGGSLRGAAELAARLDDELERTLQALESNLLRLSAEHSAAQG